VSFLEVGRNHRRRIPTRGIRKITKTSWSLGSRTDLARVGGKTRWVEALVEAEEVGEGFRGWGHQEGGSPRWIRMDPEGTLVVMVGQAVTTTSSPDSEGWVRAAEAEAGTRVVEADVMEGMEEVGAVMEVRGGMTIVIAIAITLGEATTVEGEEAIIKVVGAVTVNVGEVVGGIVGDTELPPSTLS